MPRARRRRPAAPGSASVPASAQESAQESAAVSVSAWARARASPMRTYPRPVDTAAAAHPAPPPVRSKTRCGSRRIRRGNHRPHRWPEQAPRAHPQPPPVRSSSPPSATETPPHSRKPSSVSCTSPPITGVYADRPGVSTPLSESRVHSMPCCLHQMSMTVSTGRSLTRRT